MSLVAAKTNLMRLLGGKPHTIPDNSRTCSCSTQPPPPSSSSSSSPSHPPMVPQSPELEPLVRRHDSHTAYPDDLESQTSTLGTERAYGCMSGVNGCSKDEQRQTHPSSNSASPARINARLISDATIGLSDGLTVPFALTAGLSALDDTKIVIYGGLAELIAGAISMGLGGYLGAKSEAASYQETLSRTNRLIETDPRGTLLAVRSVFEPYDLPKSTLDDLAGHISDSPGLAGFLMRFQHCEHEPSSSRAFVSGLTIALGYFIGGLLPLLPYLCVPAGDLYRGLIISVGVMAVALFSFGYAKTCMVSGWRGSRRVRGGLLGGLQMVVVGGAAAGAAMLLVKLFNSLADGVGGGGDGGP